MAFLQAKLSDGHLPATEYIPAAAGTYTVGQALVFSGGKLVSVSSGVGQDTDEGKHYVSQADVTLAAAGDLAVIPADEDLYFETELQADNDSLAIGAKYCIHTDGKCITSTTTKGCFTVLEADGKTAGAKVRGILE